MVTDPANPLSFVSGKDLSSQPSAVPTTLPPDLPSHQTNELDFNAFFNADSIPGLNVSALHLLLHLLRMLLLLLLVFEGC